MQTILIYSALHKRKVYLDAFAEGLECYKIHSLMRIFPQLFKPSFTSKELCSEDVINSIVPVGIMDNDTERLTSALFDFINELTISGTSMLHVSIFI